MSENLEAILTEINKFININQNRAKYTSHYDALKLSIFEQLKEDEVFKRLSKGQSLQGSYGDNLKVKMPDEFDLVFKLKLPEYKEVKIIKDRQNAGNVFIDLTKVLEKIKNEVQNTKIYQNLKKWVNNQNLLIVDKIQSWLTSRFKKALTSLKYQITVDGYTAQLSYKTQGPAHTISVYGKNNFFYSVDFVPGFIFDENQNYLKNVKGSWLAIPKPIKPPQPNNPSFRSSFFDQESELISDKKNLKNVLRIMKKFRDSHANMNNLKSYYIKTIFLFKSKEKANNSAYWQNSISKIVIDMFQELENTLVKKMLPLYWDKQCNMYAHFSDKQLDEMKKYVINSKELLLRGISDMTVSRRYNIYALFLNANEREEANIIKLKAINANEISGKINEPIPLMDIPSESTSRCCIA